jgi:hypothetical protein
MTGAQPPSERYAHDELFTREVMGSRTVETGAPFLAPHLKPGLQIIDCGCGQGSVTVGLAELVTPGVVAACTLLPLRRSASGRTGRQRQLHLERE